MYSKLLRSYVTLIAEQLQYFSILCVIMFLFTLLFLLLMLLLFHFFSLAIDLSIITSSPSLSHAQLSPGDLSSQTKLLFYHHQNHPPVPWELQQQLRKWQPGFLGHGLEIICSREVLQRSPHRLPLTVTVAGGREDRSLTGPLTHTDFLQPLFLLWICSVVSCKPLPLCCALVSFFARWREGYELFEIQGGNLQGKSPTSE